MQKKTSKLNIFISNKHVYFSLLNNKNLVLFSKTSCSNKFVNFNKNCLNFYLIGLKIKLILLKQNLNLPIILVNTKKTGGSLKCLIKALIN